jgi:uncharacterized protein
MIAAPSERILYLYDLASTIPPADAGHDFSHIERVSKIALKLLESEIRLRHSRSPTEDETDAVLAAALLHDCVPVAKNSPLRKESSRLASEKAFEILTAQKTARGDRAWTRDWVAEITDAILDHSFSAGRTPRSLLGECLQDADRLEALGAIGLYRTIATGVSMGASLFHATDPWAQHRDLDDRSYSLDHFFTKLLKLPATFRTTSGQKEALDRAGYLQGFVEQLKKEINP